MSQSYDRKAIKVDLKACMQELLEAGSPASTGPPQGEVRCDACRWINLQPVGLNCRNCGIRLTFSLSVNLQSDYDALERIILSHQGLRPDQRQAALNVLVRIVRAANIKNSNDDDDDID